MQTPIQARNRGFFVTTVDGRIISRQLCLSVFGFASILETRLIPRNQGGDGLDPFQRGREIPLSQVSKFIVARGARAGHFDLSEELSR